MEENLSAINFLKEFFSQLSDYSQSRANILNTGSMFSSVILRGESGCGKTHLLHIFAKKFTTEFLDMTEIENLNLSNFFSKNKIYILDNADMARDEELLLRLINSANEANAFLILTMTHDAVRFTLKDLNSRLKNIFILDIQNPGHESVKQLLVSGLARKQIKLKSNVIEFIASHIDRKYTTILTMIKLIEFRCQEMEKAIGIREVRRVLGSLNTGNL